MISYDPKCDELARHFLDDSASEEAIRDLSEWIQFHVELWFTGRNEDGTEKNE